MLPRCVCENYRRLAFRRRDACAPGCAAYAFGLDATGQRGSFLVVLFYRKAVDSYHVPPRKLPTTGVSQARRLRSLRSKAPLAVARLRCVHPSKSRKLPTTGVSQARRLLSGLRNVRLRAVARLRCVRLWRLPGALCYLDAYVKNTDDWRFAGETPALQAAQRTPSAVARLRSVRLFSEKVKFR